jgi:hypothetical protein
MNCDERCRSWFRSEQRADHPGKTVCPFCVPDRVNAATDACNTIEHAYGTCTGLNDFGFRAAEMLLLPAGEIYAPKSWTTTIDDQDQGRLGLVGGVRPHIVAGLFVVMRNADQPPSKEHMDLASNLNAW